MTRGNSAASLADHPLALNSFTPVKKHPAHLAGPLIQPTPPTSSSNAPPPTLSPPQHFSSTSPLYMGGGGVLSTSWNNTPDLPTEVAGGCVVLMAGWVCLITGHRPSLRGDLWCVLEPHDIVTTLRAVLRENKKALLIQARTGHRSGNATGCSGHQQALTLTHETAPAPQTHTNLSLGVPSADIHTIWHMNK